LKDNRGAYYIGSSEDVAARFKSHLAGEVPTTKRMKEIKIVFTQQFSTIQAAKQIEYKLKKLKRKDYIQKIIKDVYIKMKP